MGEGKRKMRQGKGRHVPGWIFGLLAVAFVIPGAYAQDEAMNVENGDTYNAWVAYWDYGDAEEEMGELSPALRSVSLFEVFYDGQQRLWLPEGFAEMCVAVEEAIPPDVAQYVSIVNDWQREDGNIAQKDGSLVGSLMDSKDKATGHAEEIIALAQELDVSGIEMDYEGLGRDAGLWRQYTAFLHILAEAAEEAGLSVRVVLEPSAPFDMLELPEAAEYVVMCYNLFGSHSGPGPKATPAFLQELVGLAAVLPGDETHAVATGGFDWGGEKGVESLTERQAVERSWLHGTTPVRDADSGCLRYSYSDEQGTAHEVWYADAQTLRLWTESIHQATGRQDTVSLWRLGGNETLAELAE